MSELQLIAQPTIMTISAFSGIGQRLNYLAQVIKDESEATSKKLYIECYKENRKLKDSWQVVNVIRLSVDMDIWTEISTYDKIDGAILPKNITVNLYDFYNIIDNCKDDIISLWIDEEESKLVINSYYNEHRDMDELEVHIPIYDIGFDTRTLISTTEDMGEEPSHSLELMPIMLYTIMAELNVEQRTDGIYITNHDGKMYFTSDYNGYKTQLTFTELNENTKKEESWTYFVPFNLMSLVAATGTVGALKLNFYNDDIGKLIITTDDYDFSYPIQLIDFDVNLPENGEDYLVVESEMAEQASALLNRLNKPAPYSIYNIKKVDGYVAEIECSYENRFAISVFADMAMLSDKEVKIDSRIFQRMFTRNMVDAVKFLLVDDENILVNIETPVYVKKLYYQHKQFLDYRKLS